VTFYEKGAATEHIKNDQLKVVILVAA